LSFSVNVGAEVFDFFTLTSLLSSPFLLLLLLLLLVRTGSFLLLPLLLLLLLLLLLWTGDDVGDISDASVVRPVPVGEGEEEAAVSARKRREVGELV
jgi:hypothetical protein